MAGEGEYPKEDGDTLFALDFNNSMGRVITKTSDYTVTTSEAYNSVLSNKGATETITFTLPEAVENMSFKIGRVEDYNIIIAPDGTDTINGENDSVYSTSGDDQFIDVIAVADNEWLTESISYWGRGLFAGGSGYSNVIDYVTILSAGNATDFGDLTVARSSLAGCSSTTRGLFGGGYTVGSIDSNVIDYVTILSAGNATDFGDLTVARYGAGGCSSSTRGLFAGGYAGSYLNTIDYVTIASVGNATDFGDLTVARHNLASCSSSTRGLFGGGFTGSYSDVIDYVTIASTGNATDFGDLTVARSYLAGCSNSHGGL